MTCKDCLCKDVCFYIRNAEDVIAEINPLACPNFKPKSRIVELPCEVGQTVYVIKESGKSRVEKAEVGEITFWKTDELHILLSFKCLYLCDDDCPFNSWSQDPSGEYSCGGEYGQVEVTNKDFGKTVFLSREDAEKALAERSK